MGSIIYLIGRSVDARQRLLARKMASREPDSALHLVPTRGRVMELEIDPRFWLTRRVDTLTRIIHQIFEENIRSEQFEAYRPIDDALQSLLVKKILEKRGTEPDGLSYFSRLLKNRNQNDFPGIYRTISSFFSFLIRNNFQDRFVQELAGRIIRLEEKSPGWEKSDMPWKAI